jgi:hypothetical protein
MPLLLAAEEDLDHGLNDDGDLLFPMGDCRDDGVVAVQGFELLGTRL